MSDVTQAAGRDGATDQEGASATWLDLYDWRSRVAAMYRARSAALAAGEDGGSVLQRFRAEKDAMFARHPQSPLSIADCAAFTSLPYFAYDPALRVAATLTAVASDEAVSAPNSRLHASSLTRAATLDFSIGGTQLQLSVYWIDVYGGGLFVPFRDTTAPDETYGAGRYLFDTVKGSDFEIVGGPIAGAQDAAALAGMGYSGGSVVIDFNYAYNPSCAYNPRWACPLAPKENWLPLPIRAGERNFPHE